MNTNEYENWQEHWRRKWTHRFRVYGCTESDMKFDKSTFREHMHTYSVLLEVWGNHGAVTAPIRDISIHSSRSSRHTRRAASSAALKRSAEVSTDGLQGTADAVIRLLATSKQGRDRPRQLVPRLPRGLALLVKFLGLSDGGPGGGDAASRRLPFLSRFHGTRGAEWHIPFRRVTRFGKIRAHRVRGSSSCSRGRHPAKSLRWGWARHFQGSQVFSVSRTGVTPHAWMLRGVGSTCTWRANICRVEIPCAAVAVHGLLAERAAPVRRPARCEQPMAVHVCWWMHLLKLGCVRVNLHNLLPLRR